MQRRVKFSHFACRHGAQEVACGFHKYLVRDVFQQVARMLLCTSFVSEYQQPSPGDVLITREGGSFAISIAPERHQLNLARLDDAILIATKWAKERNVRAWNLTEGSGFRLLD